MTNTKVLEKSYLIIPASGYELDREEMTYVDGGAYSVTQWWGIQVFLTGSEFSAFKNTYDGAGLLSSSVMGFIAAPVGIAIAIGIYIKGLTIPASASVNGARIDISWAHMALALTQPLIAATLLPIYSL